MRLGVHQSCPSVKKLLAAQEPVVKGGDVSLTTRVGQTTDEVALARRNHRTNLLEGKGPTLNVKLAKVLREALDAHSGKTIRLATDRVTQGDKVEGLCTLFDVVLILKRGERLSRVSDFDGFLVMGKVEPANGADRADRLDTTEHKRLERWDHFGEDLVRDRVRGGSHNGSGCGFHDYFRLNLRASTGA